jgi:hypothetical protein
VFASAAAIGVQVGDHDVNAILTTGALQLTVSQKPYYQCAPLHRAPPALRMQFDTSVANSSATVGEILKGKVYATGRPLKLDPGVGIMTAQNFGVTLSWPFVVATAANNARIGVVMSGWLFRGVQ